MHFFVIPKLSNTVSSRLSAITLQHMVEVGWIEVPCSLSPGWLIDIQFWALGICGWHRTEWVGLGYLFLRFLIVSRVFFFDWCLMAPTGHIPSQPVQSTTQLFGFFTTGLFLPFFSSNSNAPRVQYSTHFPQLMHFS
jgi:hypothetical protein